MNHKYNRLKNISNDTHWFDKKTKQENTYEARRVKAQTIAELENARKELKVSRATGIKELYEREAKM